jgi:large subunit ribosomal protein L24
VKVHVKKGDQVMVISGKQKGKKGKVIRVIPDKRRVVIEGVNFVKKHQRPTHKVMQGGIVDKEAPVAASAVMRICPKCAEPARFGHKDLEDGRMVCVCRRCGEVVDR